LLILEKKGKKKREGEKEVIYVSLIYPSNKTLCSTNRRASRHTLPTCTAGTTLPLSAFDSFSCVKSLSPAESTTADRSRVQLQGEHGMDAPPTPKLLASNLY